jgi:glyoxylase-like metal-dependent hydrolase (beta-lactamase superfamily II)
MARMLEPYDFAGVHVTEPRQGFSGKKVISVKGFEVVIVEVGPSHTDGDAVVFVPGERAVYAGDIVFFGSTPVMWSGPVERLIEGLKSLLMLEADVVVPGHGPIGTHADVQKVIDYWEFVQTQLHRHFSLGISPLEAAREVVFCPAFRTSAFAGWDSPERIVTNAYSLYRHWDASVGPPLGPFGKMNLMRQQAGLAFDLPDATPRAMRHFV